MSRKGGCSATWNGCLNREMEGFLGAKKYPRANLCTGVRVLKNKNKLTAAAGTATLTAAATAATDRFGWTDWKSRSHTCIDKINFDWFAGVQQIVVNQKGQSILLILCISFFWLIQSQSQRWARSAAWHKGDTKGRINLILRHVWFKILCCRLCYFKHY